MPWEQRLRICPDGDFYAALRSAQSSSVTGTIDMITTSSIKLTSGEELHPDIIVTATGLKLRMAGGSSITVASEPYEISDHFAWRASMLEGLPNWMRLLGYANASWTLGSDTAAQLACRLLMRMRK
ncbi:unnamed protein product [Aspergillus oryzae]|nr:unnamed protein product [Aspergillus oryzae]